MRLVLLALACFALAGCASNTPEPPHRYPKVTLKDMTVAEASGAFANAFRGMIAKEQTTEWDKLFRRHEIVSASDEKVLVRSANPDEWRHVGHINLYIQPKQVAGDVVVEGRMTYSQSIGTAFENENDIYESQASVQSPKGFVYAYQQIFDSIATHINLARGKPTAQGTTLRLQAPTVAFHPTPDRQAERDELEVMYFEGKLDKVRERLEPHAAKGDVSAQRVLGQMLMAGRGGPADNSRGRDLFGKALQAGDPVAQFYDNLFGHINERNPQKGIETVIAAIQAGNVDAMVALGETMLSGALKRDPHVCYTLLAIAGELGHKWAAATKPQLARDLTSSQIEQADAIARAWKERAI